MFLKRLEVVGFKSFAEQIGIDFVPGVTAVVGPNGSGKSNISDSIRWVLGEQSAKSLRGAKMEDIIFAGSDSRKPLNYAEVTLVLDNEDHHLHIDYSEVSVTRRVYRSGDSEYLINKQTCRLKDIVDLFLDSGLGREAYSIIGQGKVEEILSSKSEDRRVIFEEAAGVLKYKTRKVKAEKRLWETQENLNRVEDILFELEGQVEPLQIQSSIAKDYLEKKEQLKEIEIALLVFQITDLHAKWTDEKEKLASLKEQYQKQTKEVTEMEEQLESLRVQTNELQEAMHDAQEALLLASEALEKAEGKKQLFQEQLKHASENKETLLKSLEDKKEQLTRLETECIEKKEKLSNEEKELELLQKSVQDKEELLNMHEEDLPEKLEQAKGDYIELLNEQASIRNEARYLEEQLNQQKLKTNKLTSENDELLQAREHLKSQSKTAIEQLGKAEVGLEQISQWYRDLKLKDEQKRNQYQKKESKLYEAYQFIQKLESRKEVLEEMEADFSGFFQGVKEVLKRREQQLPGVVGAIAELVHVPKDYEAALEIALGAAMQHIVVQTEKDARQAIQFLKQNRFGRATFLPLSVLKPRELNEYQRASIQNEDGFIGVAADLIQYEKPYHNVIWNLLGHVVIARNLEVANKLASKLSYRYRVVTLDGDVVNAGGSMTGGSLKQKQTPLLGRKREVEELQEKLDSLKESSLALENSVKSLKVELKELEDEMLEAQQKGEKARAHFHECKEYKREVELQSKAMEERFSRFDREQRGYTDEQLRIQERLHELEEKAVSAEDERKQLEQNVKSLETKLHTEKSSKEELQQLLTEEKIKHAAVKERYANALTEVKRYEGQIQDLREDLADLHEQTSFLQTEMSERTSGESSWEKKIHTNRQKKQALTIQLTAMREERKKLDLAYETLEQQLKAEQAKFAYVLEQVQSIEVSVNRFDVELDHCLTVLREEYVLSYEGAKIEYQLTMPEDEAKTKVKLIKLSIQELGTVNLGAIEEYERVKERFDFLKAQQEDLLEAKATLHAVINEMDEEMTKRFEETFHQIQSHFRVVFTKLFGGGEADLVLTEPNDLLNTGVEMLVRPPGKKRQHLALLSGGERALTAIALLFAILKVRPVPFCVLDEVEAALDEANVSRFAQFLKDFSGQTQFIVITHRKGTMEEADVLYGVTMQESGVSRLVSVKLEETKELVGS
ncbi:chromosome segregation protein SMC [Alkalihalobacillus pseudalcaliphilus]|uniref:chromosome segregation protein SMC n=1 Tax=Alkalihalobacillus pseudalcaliphilus TaxID=79884 RepID=UPI00064DD8D5|nr:chromosome segregation protein SMC [Alkalihalobacillus pseudalcaliphilus]KMK77182.1 chromosome segregation protein SMC [Alkalihalobacillus pseudalcaliphilus]